MLHAGVMNASVSAGQSSASGAGGRSPVAIGFSPVPGDLSWGPAWVFREAPWEPAEIENLSQSAFLWHNFTVDVAFRVGAADLGEHVRGVAVLDFVLMLHAARIALGADGAAEVELSDRQGLWCFAVHEGVVEVRFQQATRDGRRCGSAIGRCGMEDFDAAVEQALVSALDMIFSRQPVTRRSRYLQGLAANGFVSA